jgi:putative transposase
MPHRKQCKRYNDPGHAHALTFSCFQRQPFLSKERSCQWLLNAMDHARQWHSNHLWAYVIMPEHAHVLVYPTREVYIISEFLNSVKQSVAKRALVWIREHAPAFLEKMADRQPNGKVHYRFWQRGGGYDRNLYEPAAIYQQIDYYHDNPVKRGLCQQPEEWPWSSAREHINRGSGPLSLDLEFLPSLTVTT